MISTEEKMNWLYRVIEKNETAIHEWERIADVHGFSDEFNPIEKMVYDIKMARELIEMCKAQ